MRVGLDEDDVADRHRLVCLIDEGYADRLAGGRSAISGRLCA
jgi:hypothetical protein